MNQFVARMIVAFVPFAVCGYAGAQDLTGSSWQLVEIQSMNDTTMTPDDRSNYTMEFLPEGTVAVKADCNRGTGSWESEAEGTIRFGPIAATRALCTPTSISEEYLGQFEWVRSYTFDEGNLFLATMADGSILKFEPVGAGSVTAAVLGNELTTADEAELKDAILSRLFDHYALEQGISVEQAEIRRLLDSLHAGKEQAGLTSDEELTEGEAAQVEDMERSMATAMIRQWKINKALYDEYGGRIAYQQLGPEPLDAYRAFLETRQAEGAFEIRDPVLAEAFWSYFTDDSRHDFMEPGSADANEAFSTPFWK
ncbi:META domain-containing protein [Paracoccus sp. Z330]|uniref:META domain-containing protein n=1 Tax=Paracoccus onchidii TaxID=3017813 RepID=A0ABT4ZK21_9RHOB|nr:META domain-containing protein [Paracoccus onchidii]MDB6179691.1 META domain-containing protein [Paracoccus onchidii]